MSRRWLLIALFAYVLLLLVSWWIRSRSAADDEIVERDAVRTSAIERLPGVSARMVVVPAIDGDATISTPVRISVVEFAPGSAAAAPVPGALPIVMVHGSPGHKDDFERLAPLVAAGRTVIVLDLPGFGASTHRLPEYSFRAHAHYVIELLDALAIRRAHLLGYSMGGGVVLNVIDIAPERVASLTLLSAIGVQEMELTGSYWVNHAVHGVQLAGLWLLREGTPHMGILDNSMLGIPYARNFFDSDQRPLRDILRRVQVPALILHGEADPLVPPEAAREHHRLVPQSELVMVSGSHFMPFSEPDTVARPLNDFLARVDRGEGIDRAHASSQAIQSAARPFDPRSLPRLRGIALVVTTLVVGSGAAVLPEAGAVVAGVLLGHGRIGIIAVVVALVAGLVGRRLIVRAVRFSHSRPRRQRQVTLQFGIIAMIVIVVAAISYWL